MNECIKKDTEEEDEGYFTEEELESIQKYLNENSVKTGINIFDYL